MHFDRPAFIWKRIAPDDGIYPKLHSWRVSRLGKQSHTKALTWHDSDKICVENSSPSQSLLLGLCWVFDLAASLRPPDIQCVLSRCSLLSCFSLNFCFWISHLRSNSNLTETVLLHAYKHEAACGRQLPHLLHCYATEDSFYTSFSFIYISFGTLWPHVQTHYLIKLNHNSTICPILFYIVLFYLRNPDRVESCVSLASEFRPRLEAAEQQLEAPVFLCLSFSQINWRMFWCSLQILSSSVRSVGDRQTSLRSLQRCWPGFMSAFWLLWRLPEVWCPH